MREQNLWIRGYRLTTAEILYHMPDYPELLQTYTWQDLDLAPNYPVLAAFLGAIATTMVLFIVKWWKNESWE